MTWNVNGLTRRYARELACDREAARGLADLVRVSPLPYMFSERLHNRPTFLEAAEVHRLEADVTALYDLLVTLPDRLFDGDLHRFGEAVGFSPTQMRLGLRTAPSWPPPFVARADLYRDSTGFKLLELNLTSALGGFQTFDVARHLLRADILRTFAEREGLTCADPMPVLADMLRRRHRDPVVALADWPSAYPEWEPMLKDMGRRFGELGIDARACHVGQLRAGASGLTLDGAHVDTVFRYFDMSQASSGDEALELIEPIARACESGQAELFLPLTAPLLCNKQVLVMLSDERHRHLFSDGELALIDRLLPWTRELRDGPVHVDGTVADLREVCLASRDSLVIKPGYLYGGEGVVTGWTVDDERWRAALDRAWNGPFVVQRRVVPLPEPFADFDSGELVPWLVLWGVFVLDGRYAGCYQRFDPSLDAGVVSLHSGAWLGTTLHRRDA